VVIRDTEGNVRMCTLVKGSPDAILPLVSVDEEDFKGTVTRLGTEGYRIIALGMQDITHNSTIVETLFPTGFQNSTLSKKVIAKAKRVAETLVHRDSVESTPFDFCGFSCFEAAVRPSSPRVIQQLQQAQIGVTMLTGDGVDVAVSVARRCRIISESAEIVLLDYDAATEAVVWRKLYSDNGTNKTSTLSTRSVLSGKEDYAFVATGNAVSALSKRNRTTDENILYSKLKDFSVFALASPPQKVLVVSALKQNGKKVIMCGTFLMLTCLRLSHFGPNVVCSQTNDFGWWWF